MQDDIEALELAVTEVPPAPMIWVENVTPEKLGIDMSEHDETMSVISDEGGIFDILAGRYSNSGVADLDLVLKAHPGSPARVRRVGREPVHLESPALTLIVSPQPGVLQGLAAKPIYKIFRDRGFLARFLYVLPQSNIGFRSGDGPMIPDEITREHDICIRRMLDFKRPGESPALIALSADAYNGFCKFADMVEKLQREDARLEHLTDWAGKLAAATARIAGNLHVADHVYGMPADIPLSGDTMDRAIMLGTILIEHALAVFDLMGADLALHDARKVWAWIKRTGKTKFSFRDCHQTLRAGFPRAENLEDPIATLVERYYISPVEMPSRDGRPSRIFEVNPLLSEGWEK